MMSDDEKRQLLKAELDRIGRLLGEASMAIWPRDAPRIGVDPKAYGPIHNAMGALANIKTLLSMVPPGEEATHCPTCICGKRAPVQRVRALPATSTTPAREARAGGTIAWSEHLEAYVDYAGRYNNGQTAERLAERGGFGYWELTKHLGHEPTTWTPR